MAALQDGCTPEGFGWIPEGLERRIARNVAPRYEPRSDGYPRILIFDGIQSHLGFGRIGIGRTSCAY